jgi:predicted DNA-binding transcriptional regulator YafY
MAAITQDRIERLKLIERILPCDKDGNRAMTLAELGNRLADELGRALHLRTLQRDIVDLREEGRVRLLDTGIDGSRYQRVSEADEFDPVAWEYMLATLKNELSGVISARQLERVLSKLQLPDGGCGLDESKLRIIPDSLRLQPAEIKPDVLAGILRGLSDNLALRVMYEDRLGKRSEPVLHPLGLLQRGPSVYLYAMKNDEITDRMYAVHRMIHVECLPIVARQLDGFDLDQRIASGRADFAEGQTIQLKAIVRGYVETLLYECPLGPGQTMAPLEDEELGSLLSIELPSSGQLLRWILAGGENITVLEPVELQALVFDQTRRLCAQYQALAGDKSKKKAVAQLS